MAWTDPGDFTSGQILTAAEMDNIREAMFFGQATFTTAAARDAAIPATGITLQEGMRAYLTAPAATTVTATGATTFVPTGITTIYDGSAWVCVTPIGAKSETTGTTTSTAAFVTTLTGDTTAVSVTLPTGTTALVHLYTDNSNSGAANSNYMALSVSGATTIAATNASGILSYNVGFQTTARSTIFTGLTAGVNTFTLNYKTSAGTASYYQRHLVVQGIA